jgi:hypothetical protein
MPQTFKDITREHLEKNIHQYTGRSRRNRQTPGVIWLAKIERKDTKNLNKE